MQPTAYVQPGTIQLHGVAGVDWSKFLMRSAVRSLVLWPIVNFVGGVGGVRGALTATCGGVAFTAAELAFNAAEVAFQTPGAAAPDPTFAGVGGQPGFDYVDASSWETR